MNRPTSTLCFTLACAIIFGGKLPAKDEKIKLENCPPAVQKIFNEKAAGGKIGKVEKATEDGAIVYEAEIKTAEGKDTEVVASSDGKLVAVELKVDLAQCPEAVQSVIKEKAAGGKIKGIEKVTAANGKVSYTAEIKPAKGDVMDLEVTPKGKIVKFEADKD